jgi:hypothetical protein
MLPYLAVRPEFEFCWVPSCLVFFKGMVEQGYDGGKFLAVLGHLNCLFQGLLF